MLLQPSIGIFLEKFFLILLISFFWTLLILCSSFCLAWLSCCGVTGHCFAPPSPSGFVPSICGPWALWPGKGVGNIILNSLLSLCNWWKWQNRNGFQMNTNQFPLCKSHTWWSSYNVFQSLSKCVVSKDQKQTNKQEYIPEVSEFRKLAYHTSSWRPRIHGI